MPIRPIESGPLTSREIKELDGFLLAEDGLENPMDFSEWLRWVWDQELRTRSKGTTCPSSTSGAAVTSKASRSILRAGTRSLTRGLTGLR
jgi:hypothetical protein